MHIQAQVVAGAVRHPAAVLTALNGERNISGNRQQAPLFQTVRQNVHGCLVNLVELGTRLSHSECGVSGIQHSVVDLRLNLGELTVHGEGAGHVSGVQGVVLNACVQQQQLAVIDGAVVTNPVQDSCVVTARCDGVVAQVVTVGTCHGEERSLNDALTAVVLLSLRQCTNDLFEALDGHVNGTLQVLNLDSVLNQASLGESHSQLGVQLVSLLQLHAGVVAGGVNQRVNSRVNVADQADVHAAQALVTGVLGDSNLKLGQVAGTQTEALGEFLQGGAGANPELAVACIRVELCGVAASQRAEVQGDLVVGAVVAGTLFDGLEDQHGVGLVVDAQTGLVSKRRVGAEAVVAVVGADLQRACRQDEALAGECLGDLGAALSCVVCYGLAGVAVIFGRCPVCGNEFGERRRLRGAAVVSLLSFGALLVVLSHGLIISPSPQVGRCFSAFDHKRGCGGTEYIFDLRPGARYCAADIGRVESEE